MVAMYKIISARGRAIIFCEHLALSPRLTINSKGIRSRDE